MVHPMSFKTDITDGIHSTTLRRPRVEDGPRIWKLAKDAKGLDLNSPYCYLALCSHFQDTCVVAERAGNLVGFVTGYRPPRSGNVLFVWQIAVTPSCRGEGIALAMLQELLRRDSCEGVSYMDTTVTHSNTASRRLFASLQRRLRAPCVETVFYPDDLFPDDVHPEECLLRIGPFDLFQIKRMGD